ncbi:hypothetical protein FQR65_LT08008 [Abscondita terminalis]|nr:hypothetical protein FQR65_LT08008 [Abscondita terminalis]
MSASERLHEREIENRSGYTPKSSPMVIRNRVLCMALAFPITNKLWNWRIGIVANNLNRCSEDVLLNTIQLRVVGEHGSTELKRWERNRFKISCLELDLVTGRIEDKFQHSTKIMSNVAYNVVKSMFASSNNISDLRTLEAIGITNPVTIKSGKEEEVEAFTHFKTRVKKNEADANNVVALP